MLHRAAGSGRFAAAGQFRGLAEFYAKGMRIQRIGLGMLPREMSGPCSFGGEQLDRDQIGSRSDT